jgi:hypothetical protein
MSLHEAPEATDKSSRPTNLAPEVQPRLNPVCRLCPPNRKQLNPNNALPLNQDNCNKRLEARKNNIEKNIKWLRQPGL